MKPRFCSSWPAHFSLGLAAFFAGLFVSARPLFAQAYPGCNDLQAEPFKKTVLADKLSEPMGMAALPDGRLLVTERTGSVKVIKPDAVGATVAAKLNVNSVGDAALMGIAADPAFAQNGWVFIYWLSKADDKNLRLSRFKMTGDALDPASEKVIMTVPFEVVCCHLGGDVSFGKEGLLYLSTGENTSWVPAFSNRDESDRSKDAQRSSGNTADLRGKILRIKVKALPDAGAAPTPGAGSTYDIPAGNLFAVGQYPEGKTRPEIYTMGHRNPFRIFADPVTGWLLWGEIGTDNVAADPTKGPAGHDEFNIARAPGNFGWPFFVADNKPYVTNGVAFNAAAPVNASKNNSGLTALPPAQPAALWYTMPSGNAKWPGFSTRGDDKDGGRCAMGGPIYRYDGALTSKSRLPPHLDGKWITFDWSQNWFKAFTLDAQGSVTDVVPLFKSLEFQKPMDAAIGPDGALYVLEYGTQWNMANANAAVSRIDYQGTCLPATSAVQKSKGITAPQPTGYGNLPATSRVRPLFQGAFPVGLNHRLDGKQLTGF